MLRSTKNELLIGLTLSTILSLSANFTLLSQYYDSSIKNSATLYELTLSIFWFFFFPFVFFMLYRWIYRRMNNRFQRKEPIAIGIALVVTMFSAYGLYQMYPILRKTILENILNAQTTGCHTKKIAAGTIKIKVIPTIEAKNGNYVTAQSIDPMPFFTKHIFVMALLLLSLALLHLLDKRQKMKLEYEKIKNEKLQSSYDALMGQINPHFFFNSLNGLYSLIYAENKIKTLEYLEGLSKIFRYVLQSNRKTLVTLEEELQFIKAYTYLLSVRYESKLFVSTKVSKDCLNKRLPVLSLLPLIENAVKHNVVSKRYPLEIRIYTEAECTLTVLNAIRPKMEECVSNGIGLRNLQGRYQMLTGKSIRISDVNGYFEVSLPLLEAQEKDVR